jgi:hypothetical protein
MEKVVNFFLNIGSIFKGLLNTKPTVKNLKKLADVIAFIRDKEK